jgi:uncharacterized protein
MQETYIQRSIEDELIRWKNSEPRKPLLLRGARQVGKTTVIRKLSEEFNSYLEINFEQDKEVHKIFDQNLNPDILLSDLSVYYGIKISAGDTLVFFDEIQSCPNAISSLRFFYERKPDLHLIAAGSLLEFALESLASYGVGRIRSLFLYPLSFDEFLIALGENQLLQRKLQSNPSSPLPEPIHNKLIRHLKHFLIIGGMPEAVINFAINQNIIECQRVIDDLVISFTDDFAKYKNRVPAARLSEVFRSVVMQIGGKFTFSKVSEHATHNQIKEAIALLMKAGLVIPVNHSHANGIPLGAEQNTRYRKMIILDTGIAQRISGLDLREIIIKPDWELVNKGSLAELFTGLEILKYAHPYEKKELWYWQRQAKNSNAEIDYIVQKGNEIIPVEVKSGTKGSMQSLQIFLAEKKKSKGIRISLENFAQYQNIVVFPLYAISSLVNG